MCDVQWSDDDSDMSSLDSDEAALDYEAELEEQLDNAYNRYLERKGERGGGCLSVGFPGAEGGGG